MSLWLRVFYSFIVFYYALDIFPLDVVYHNEVIMMCSGNCFWLFPLHVLARIQVLPRS